MSQLTTISMCSAITIFSANAVVADSLVFPQTEQEWIQALALDAPQAKVANAASNRLENKGICRRAGVKVQFGSNAVAVRRDIDSKLDALGAALSKYPAKVKVDGYTDDKGPDLYNKALSKRRAVTVRDYLVANYGIARQQLSVVGYGESYPLNKNSNEEERKLNRRVEFVKCD